MTSVRRCQALSIRPTQNANDPPPWAKQIRSDSGDPVEHPAEDHGQDRQVGLGGHADQPLGHPAVAAGATSGMSHGWTNTGAPDGRAVLEERDHALVVEVTVADVVADLDARVPGGQAPVQLRAGRVGVLQRHLAERHAAGPAHRRRSPGRGR